MAAALGHDADSQDLDCCAPKFFVGNCSGLKIHKSEIHQMVKMDCTYSDCTQVGKRFKMLSVIWSILVGIHAQRVFEGARGADGEVPLLHHFQLLQNGDFQVNPRLREKVQY